MQSKIFRWLGLFVSTFLLIVVFARAAMAITPHSHDQLQFPPLKEVQFPDYDRYQLPNGITVYLVEDHELPLVSGTAIFKTGSRLEPGDKVGLASLTGSVMRSGGTKTHPPDELNQILEERAASVETGIGDTSGSASFEALTEDLDLVFDLFAEVIQEPAFPQDKLELEKKQISGSIARRNDDPDEIASREFDKLIYGDTSPYARTVEYSTLAKISRQDLIDFYQQSFRPERMILGIVGDFEPAQVKKLIQTQFGNWQPTLKSNLPTLPQVKQQQKEGIFFVEQPQLTQSYIQLGHLGGQLNDPDYGALSVVNGVLNGFGGRLFNEVRSRQGLAYSVYGVWSPRYDYPGVFMAGGQTRSEATVPFIKSLLAEIEKIRTISITSQELAYAKESILNSFVFRFQDPGQILTRLMNYEYYGYPVDYIFQYQRAVKATSIEDVKKVAQKYLNPNQITTLVVGSSQAIQPPLTQINSQIQAIDIAIPEQVPS